MIVDCNGNLMLSCANIHSDIKMVPNFLWLWRVLPLKVLHVPMSSSPFSSSSLSINAKSSPAATLHAHFCSSGPFQRDYKETNAIVDGNVLR